MKIREKGTESIGVVDERDVAKIAGSSDLAGALGGLLTGDDNHVVEEINLEGGEGVEELATEEKERIAEKEEMEMEQGRERRKRSTSRFLKRFLPAAVSFRVMENGAPASRLDLMTSWRSVACLTTRRPEFAMGTGSPFLLTREASMFLMRELSICRAALPSSRLSSSRRVRFSRCF